MANFTTNNNYNTNNENLVYNTEGLIIVGNTMKNVMPNPLTSSGFINSKFNNSNYATSDFNGIETSNIYKDIKSIVVMNNIDDDMYLPSLGELSVALENISYINNKIENNNNKISLNSKYISGTLYTNSDISDSEYKIGNNEINHIWYFDTTYAKITYGTIGDNYKLLPFYKYEPIIYDESDEDYYTSYYTTLSISENMKKGTNSIDPFDIRNLNLHEDYFCDNLSSYIGSFVFNYRNSDILDKITKNNNYTFSYIFYELGHEIWPIPHNIYNLSFPIKYTTSQKYENIMEIDFIMIIPNFKYNIEDTFYNIKVNKNTSNDIISMNDIVIEVTFDNPDLNYIYKLYPSKYSMKDCKLFKLDRKIYLDMNDFNEYEDKLLVDFSFKMKDSNTGLYSIDMFSLKYYFDIYNLKLYGNYFTGMDEYCLCNLNKINILNTKTLNKYYNIKNNPILSKKLDPLNITYFYSDSSLDGIRVNQLNDINYLNEQNICKYSYNNIDLGVSYIDKFFNNGLRYGIYNDQEIYSYFYEGYGNTFYNGNNDISITSKYINNSCFLRTFNHMDEFGVYDDCILNNMFGPNPDENNSIRFRITQYSNELTKYQIFNLPSCGTKQYMMFAPININNLHYGTMYLFLINNNDFTITISLEDKSKTLCLRKTYIKLQPHEIKLYYPALYDYKYKIILSSQDYNKNDFDVYNLFNIQVIPQKYQTTQLDYISYFYGEFKSKNTNLTSENILEKLQSYVQDIYINRVQPIKYEYTTELNIDFYSYPLRGYVIDIRDSQITTTGENGGTVINSWTFEDEYTTEEGSTPIGQWSFEDE